MIRFLSRAPMIQAVVVDQETLAALKQLKSRGIVFGSEANRDGDNSKAARKVSA